MSQFLQPLISRRGGPHVLVNARAGLVVADVVEAAFESKTRRKGLLGRDSLPERHAIVLAPCNAVHTCGMRFPIDVLFVTRDGCVVKIVERLGRWRAAASLRAAFTVELAAGGARRAGVIVGDRLSIQRDPPTNVA